MNSTSSTSGQKGNVKACACPQSLINDGDTLTPPPDENSGYYLLPYSLLNYAVACKPCNSGLKNDYFPVSGPYATDGEAPREMTVEQPWLLYPIGHLDVDPENVITFEGFLPQTNCDDPLLRLRGLVTIEFFNCARSFPLRSAPAAFSSARTNWPPLRRRGARAA